MPKRTHRRTHALAWIVAVAALGGCGSDKVVRDETCPAGTTGTPPNCTAVQTCSQTVVVQDAGSAKPRILYYNDFSVPDTGRFDMTVDWTIPASPIGVYLVPANTCTIDEFNRR